MSKAARAFATSNTLRFAGQTRLQKTTTHRDITEYNYNKEKFDLLSSFADPFPMLFKPENYLPLEALGRVFVRPSEVKQHIDKYFEETIKPWCAANEITKYRVVLLTEPRREYEHTIENMINTGTRFYGGGIIFKRKSHAMLFKLSF